MQSNTAVTLDCAIDNIFSAEIILKSVQELCLNRELLGNYYNLENDGQKNLSIERNTYMELISAAIEKLEEFKKSADKLGNIYFLKQNPYDSCR